MGEGGDPEWGSMALDNEDGQKVIARSYGWTIMSDGTVAALIAGDMGYEATHITIPREDIIALVEDWPEFKDKT